MYNKTHATITNLCCNNSMKFQIFPLVVVDKNILFTIIIDEASTDCEATDNQKCYFLFFHTNYL